VFLILWNRLYNWFGGYSQISCRLLFWLGLLSCLFQLIVVAICFSIKDSTEIKETRIMSIYSDVVLNWNMLYWNIWVEFVYKYKLLWDSTPFNNCSFFFGVLSLKYIHYYFTFNESWILLSITLFSPYFLIYVWLRPNILLNVLYELYLYSLLFSCVLVSHLYTTISYL
jgi:hypothetical protein